MKTKIEHRNTLYYSKYQYKVCIDMSSRFRFRYHDNYDDCLPYLNDSLFVVGQSFFVAHQESDLPAREEVARYYQWHDSINKTDHDYRTRQEGIRFSLYSNDLLFLQAAAAAINPVKGIEGYYHAVTPSEPDVMSFRQKPKFAYRKYFKATYYDKEQRDSLVNFICAQQEMGTRISMSPRLTQRLKKFNNPAAWGWYVPQSSFIEYDDESMVMALMLMFGDSLQPKTYRLVQRTDTV